MPTVVVIARTVSQVSVEVTSEYSPNDARFSPSGAPATYDSPLDPPTANGQNQKFISRPNRYDDTMPYATSIAISRRAAVRREPILVRRGSKPAPAATQPHAKTWNGVQGPMPPHSTD